MKIEEFIKRYGYEGASLLLNQVAEGLGRMSPEDLRRVGLTTAHVSEVWVISGKLKAGLRDLAEAGRLGMNAEEQSK